MTFKDWFATKIQCLFKSFKIRLRFKKLLNSVVKCQSTWRMCMQRRKYKNTIEKKRLGAIKKIQNRFRMFLNNKAKNKVLLSAMKIQSTYLAKIYKKN